MAFYLAQAAKACKNPAARSVYSASALLRLSATANRIPSTFSRLAAPYSYVPTLGSTLNFTRYQSSLAAATKPQATIPDSEDLEGANAGDTVAFDSLRGIVADPVLDAITHNMKITHLSIVQKEVLPLLPELARPYSEDEPDSSPPRDILVKAKTGTGKTLAFLVPAIEKRMQEIQKHVARAAEDVGKTQDKRFKDDIEYRYTRETVGTLILSPTRELANQIAKEALKLTANVDRGHFGVRTFVGGEDKRNQMRQWRTGRRDIVVATPGRLRDMIDSEPEVRRSLETAQLLILDEADTLLEFGFRSEIDAIASHLPPSPQRQTFLFSATVSPQIRDIARATLNKKHKFINCVPADEAPVHSHVPQYHTVVPSAADQLPHVLRLVAHDQLTNPGKSKVMIFLPTTKMTQLYATIFQELKAEVLPAGRSSMLYEMHSRKSMDQRTRTSDRFRSDVSGASVLVSSDVSARGVDYPGVTRVIQVGIPSSGDQYVHRVGRTGRGSARDNGRGDLVLLDWEAGFVKPRGCLAQHGVPLKGVTVEQLRQEVGELAAKFDQDPASFFADAPVAETQAFDSRGAKSRLGLGGRAREVAVKGPVRLKQFQQQMAMAISESAADDSVQKLKESMDEEAVKEVFTSLLGYYFGKAEELSLGHRGGKEEILEGLKNWTMEAGGLAVPPHVSQAFLAKVGFGARDSRGASGGRDNRGMGQERRGGFGEKRGGFGGERGGFGEKRGGFGYSGGRDTRGGDRQRRPERGAPRENDRYQSGRRSFDKDEAYGDRSGRRSFDRDEAYGDRSARRFNKDGGNRDTERQSAPWIGRGRANRI